MLGGVKSSKEEEKLINVNITTRLPDGLVRRGDVNLLLLGESIRQSIHPSTIPQ